MIVRVIVIMSVGFFFLGMGEIVAVPLPDGLGRDAEEVGFAVDGLLERLAMTVDLEEAVEVDEDGAVVGGAGPLEDARGQ